MNRMFFRFVKQAVNIPPVVLSRFSMPQRSLAHGPPMTKPMIEDRVMLVLRLYDKINPDKLTLESNFSRDFGMDSLDHVELVMAIEEEFNVDSERFRTPKDVIRYLCDKYDNKNPRPTKQFASIRRRNFLGARLNRINLFILKYKQRLCGQFYLRPAHHLCPSPSDTVHGVRLRLPSDICA
ncbi:unnamed protein product [Dicrocoelium dendriticum]|nr:unnamed protein product [Dicrocoelium dendriticum]